MSKTELKTSRYKCLSWLNEKVPADKEIKTWMKKDDETVKEGEGGGVGGRGEGRGEGGKEYREGARGIKRREGVVVVDEYGRETLHNSG